MVKEVAVTVVGAVTVVVVVVYDGGD